VNRRLRELPRRDDGSAAIEYMLALVFVVMPIAVSVPMLWSLLLGYFYRISSVVAGPFP